MHVSLYCKFILTNASPLPLDSVDYTRAHTKQIDPKQLWNGGGGVGGQMCGQCTIFLIKK